MSPKEEKWYPDRLNVPESGVDATLRFIETCFESSDEFVYAEFGYYRGGTAEQICRRFPKASLHLFDFEDKMESVANRLSTYPNEVFFYGSTQRYLDSYNWSLMQLIVAQKSDRVFDYCFLDGAHTFAIDALSFFLIDKLLKVGGFLDFDDYSWKLRGSSLDPSKVPATQLMYTEEQIDSPQVRLIVDYLVKPDMRYKEIIKNKVYQKVSNS